jgi:predicted glycoside hydrolase/deacetylase ChbG (UPF0249 family)
LKRLIVNADDFGFTRDVNRGIAEANREGILTATTLMANGSAFEDAVELARAAPGLDVGCHLVLAGGRSVLPPYAPLPLTVTELIRGVALGRVRPYEELSAQVRKIVAAGVRPTHLDTHKHTHLLPPVLDAVARISREFGIAWVRRPFDFPIDGVGVPWTRRAVSRGLGFLSRRVARVLDSHGCRTTDHFAGFRITGLFRTAELVALIRALPEGLTELMCHPGRCTDELRAARTRLKESRERELEALVAPETRQALRECGVELANYR